jgi:predicted ATPase
VPRPDATRRRHAEYFRQLFDVAFADWFRMPDAEWHALYLREIDDVRHALDWALRAGGEAAIGISLAASSRPLWRALGLHEEGTQWLEVALSQVDSRTSSSGSGAAAASRWVCCWNGLPPPSRS